MFYVACVVIYVNVLLFVNVLLLVLCLDQEFGVEKVDHPIVLNGWITFSFSFPLTSPNLWSKYNLSICDFGVLTWFLLCLRISGCIKL